MNIGKESETVEFEESMCGLKEGIISLTAMLNGSNEGTLYLGVRDDGEVIGLTLEDHTLETIRNRIRGYIRPRILSDVKVLESDDGKRYVSVRLRGYEIPYSCTGMYFVRHGDSDVSASPETIAEMVLYRGYDAMREMESPEQALSFGILNILLTSGGLCECKDFDSFGKEMLLTKRGRFNLNASILSDENRWAMRLVEFQGVTRNAPSKVTEYDGCMFLGMMRVFDAMQSRVETKVGFSSGRRVDHDLFDIECFREAWFNACLHNSWHTGIPPLVTVFDDRVEIESIGSTPRFVPEEDLFEGRSAPINESLYRLAVIAGFVEESGNGIPTISRKYGCDAVRITGGSVTVTIPFGFEPARVTIRKCGAPAETALNDRERRILDCIRADGNAKISEIAERTALSESSVKRTISSLKNRGMLENRGSNRCSVWAVLIR